MIKPMLNSLDLLKSELGWKSLKCSAHCLQLCLKPGFIIPSINKLLAAARKLVGHFNHSVVATQALKRKHQQISSDTNKKSEASYSYDAKNGQCHYKQIDISDYIVLVFAAYIHICKL